MADITSVADAKEAIESWKFPLDKLEFFVQAFDEIKKQEAKKIGNTIPKLEKENFRIDSTGWKEIVSPNGIRIKENTEADIWEFLEGEYIGEQLFKYKAAIREIDKVGKKLPYSWEVYKDILEQKYQWDYQNFFVWENIKFCGWRNQLTQNIDNLNEEFNMWCGDAGFFTGHRTWKWHRTYWDRWFGTSIRCLASTEN